MYRTEGGGGGIGGNDEDRMGGKDDFFLDRIREYLVQRIKPPHPNPPQPTRPNQIQFKILIAIKTNRSFQAKKEENIK